MLSIFSTEQHFAIGQNATSPPSYRGLGPSLLTVCLYNFVPQVTDIQEKFRRVDVERDTYIRKCREITETYEQKIRVLQQQISELRTQPTRPVQPIQQPIPVPQPTIVNYSTAPCYVDTMTELGISIEKYNEMKYQRDSIEQR